MKKAFSCGTLVDRLRRKVSVDQSAVSEKLEMARRDVNGAETILAEVQRHLLTVLRLRSSRVVDTLGHTSTPIFSVGCSFLSLFPGHTNGLQVLAYGINPVFFSVFLVCA